MNPNPQTMTDSEKRVELAKRIRDKRAVSHQNDPKRTYRANMQRCRKEKTMYHRLTGFPWASKGT